MTIESKAVDNAPPAFFDDAYYTVEYDISDMEAVQQLELQEASRKEARSMNHSDDIYGAHEGLEGDGCGTDKAKFALLNPNLKYLLAAIESHRGATSLSDRELRNLIADIRPNRSKWASDEKIGQEQLYEACEMVLNELRNYTEHSPPFLNKVNKRDVPDYYDVIKNPMDLGTVGRNLRSFKYKSKKEFADDLFLIYQNCFTYNTDPTNIYRKHAFAMKKKTTALLEHVPDVLVRDRAEVEAEEESDDEKDGGTPPPGDQLNPDDLATSGTANIIEDSEMKDSDLISATDVLPEIRRENTEPLDSMIVKPAEEEVNQGGSQKELLENSDSSCWRFTTWRDHTKRTRAEFCNDRERYFSTPFHEREALIRHSSDMQRYLDWRSRHEMAPLSLDISRLQEDDHNTTEDERDAETSVRGEEFIPEYSLMCGLPEEPGKPNTYITRNGTVKLGESSCSSEPVADLFSNPVEMERFQSRLPSLDCYPSAKSLQHGAAHTIESSITKLKNIKHIYQKVSVIKSGLPTSRSDVLRPSGTPIPIQPPSQNHDREGSNALPPLLLNDSTANELLKRTAVKLLAHTGFDGAQASALQVLTDAAAEYFMNLGKTMKSYCDTYHKKMTGEEILLHSLYENQVDGILSLENYVKEDIDKYGLKLSDLCRRLEYTYSEIMAAPKQPAENIILGKELEEDDEEAFTFGNFSEEVGEDFFGFKELGLDKEYGMSQLTIPTHLLKGTESTSADGVMTKIIEEPLPYPPPPHFPPIRPVDQIGLLRPFFERRLEEGGGKIMEDEFLYKRHLPRFPPTGKLTSKSVLAKKKAPTEADLVKKRKQEQLQEERDARKKAKAEAKAARMMEKSEKKRMREEKKEKDRLDKLQKKMTSKKPPDVVVPVDEAGGRANIM